MTINNSLNLLKQTIWQIPSITLLAFLVSITANHFRSDPIPLIGDWSVDARFADSSGESMVIPLSQASTMFQNKTALFIDARPKEQYDQGHIKGALSLPQQEADRYFMELADQLEESHSGKNGYKTIITYCDGDSCELSHELALFLKDMGFSNVKVLVNGWSSWQGTGLPVMGE